MRKKFKNTVGNCSWVLQREIGVDVFVKRTDSWVVMTKPLLLSYDLFICTILIQVTHQKG